MLALKDDYSPDEFQQETSGAIFSFQLCLALFRLGAILTTVSQGTKQGLAQ